MSFCFYYFFLFGFIFNVLRVRGCERSLEVRGVEDYCWTKNVEVVDRLHYTGKTVLNFAKKKLGMEVETDDTPQTCEYYNCIFQELKMLNGDGYPCHERITTWIKNNIVYNHAVILLSRVDVCSAGLSKSIKSKTLFSVELLEGTTGDGENDTQSELQSKCEIVSEYMKCMSVMEKNEHCPVFQYP